MRIALMAVGMFILVGCGSALDRYPFDTAVPADGVARSTAPSDAGTGSPKVESGIRDASDGSPATNSPSGTPSEIDRGPASDLDQAIADFDRLLADLQREVSDMEASFDQGEEQ